MEGRTLSEYTQRKLYNEEEHSTSWCESKDLWHETFIERRGAFFAEDCHEGGECPVVFWYDAWNLGRTLNARFDNLDDGNISVRYTACARK